jgi:uncharacterized protein
MTDRLASLPTDLLPGGLRVVHAHGTRARLRGLAGLDRLPAGWALRIPHCRSVHTFGMRFPLDVLFLDREGDVARVARGVPPGRLIACSRARAVLETNAGEADRFLQELVR